MKKKLLYLLFIIFFLPDFVFASSVSERLAGRILLQVEEHGEAWYVNPVDLRRYFLGRPVDAFNIMREQGVGISNSDLNKIAVAEDEIEIDIFFARKHAGKIFLQVEKHGEAWYVNPVDLRRYFLGKPSDAFDVMRNLGLGINNSDLSDIMEGVRQNSQYIEIEIERKIFDLINEERQKNNLSSLTWNEDLASVAREHSTNLAKENDEFTEMGMTCDYPIIHHEGLDFGATNSDRLENRGIYYYSSAAENIALLTEAQVMFSYMEGDGSKEKMDQCGDNRESLINNFKTILDAEEIIDKKIKIVEAEIIKRKNLFAQETKMKIEEITWASEDNTAQEMVDGWMNSPGHRANILTAEYDESGLGIARVNGYIIGTQIFIRRVGCGYNGGPCCEEIHYHPYCYIPLECGEGKICEAG